MTRPAILLDLDGTLVDSLPDIAASTNVVRAECGLPPLRLEQVRRMVGEGAHRLVERAVADAGPGVTVEAALAAFRDDYAERCVAAVEPYPGVVEVLQAWHDAGVGLGVVTNKPESFARRIVEHLHLDGFCRVVVGGDTTPERKPSPVPLRAALAQLGRRHHGADQRIELAWIIGDGLPDLQAGRAAGLHTVAVTYGYGDPAALRAAGADAYWDRLQVGPLPGLSAP